MAANQTVSLLNSQCSCVTSYNQFNNSYLDCVCKGVPQCLPPQTLMQSPPVATQAPCSTAYPCSCAQTSAGLNCNCTNPSTGLTASTTNVASQCSCSNTITSNSTWSQSCSCCLANDFVRNQLIPPVTCQGFNPLKETCSCTNATISNSSSSAQLICNCIHPTSYVAATGLVLPAQGQCDCPTVTLGTQACNCCVPYNVQVQQMTPVCANNSQLESCSCSTNYTSLNCNCNSTRPNLGGLLFQNINTNTSSCYCTPSNTSAPKACNCCQSESSFLKVTPTCSAGRAPAQCQCGTNATNGVLNCSCANYLFFNKQIQVNASTQNCACASPSNSSQSSVNCTCCTSSSDMIPSPTCSAQQQTQSANCTQCAYNSTSKTVTCNCAGVSVLNAMNPVSLTNVTSPLDKCGCSNSAAGTSCSCCVNQALWLTATPTCNSNLTSSESCQCRNASSQVPVQQLAWTMVAQTNNVTCRVTGYNGELCQSTLNTNTTRVWNNTFACYAKAVCTYQPSTMSCGWNVTQNLTSCLANPVSSMPAMYQNLTSRPSTTTPVTTMVNQTYLQWVNVTVFNWTCNCANSRYPKSPITNAPVTPSTCGCNTNAVNTNQSCTCCVPKAPIDDQFLSGLQCAAKQSISACQCSSSTGISTCTTCAPLNSMTVYSNLFVNTSACLCTNQTGLQNCRCCLGPQASLVPAAPACSSNANSQSCLCTNQYFASSGQTNYKCSCNQTVNITVYTNATNTTNATSTTTQQTLTKVQNLTPSQCGCLNVTTGNSN